MAKYFSNSLREDGLLAIATHGVVYAPGSAGTTQDVDNGDRFQLFSAVGDRY